jgi:hypothetical protein
VQIQTSVFFWQWLENLLPEAFLKSRKTHNADIVAGVKRHFAQPAARLG